MNGWSFDPSVVLFLLALTCFYAVGLVRDQRAGQVLLPPLGEGWGEGRSPGPSSTTIDGAHDGQGTVLTLTLSQREREGPFAGSITVTKVWSAFLGILTLALALLSPLDTLGDRGLFVAHMAQHLLLLLVAPVGLIAGAPARASEAVHALAATRVGGLATSLPVLLIASVGAIWIWHAPRFFDMALQNGAIHLFEHACFLGTAVAFWWPVVQPRDFPRRPPELALLLYLFAAAVACSLLGALITLGGQPLYSAGVAPAGATSVAAARGLTRIADQQLGGILMWGFGGMWYFVAAGIVFGQWYARALAREAGPS
jgi:cytochrome c oxidase assembly factor CtaG